MTISRREIFGLASAIGIANVSIPFFAAHAQPTNSRVRENVRAFVQDQQKLNALRLAVKTMKDRSAAQPDDPTGWNYWASSHGTTTSVPPALQRIYNQCDHSDNGYTAVHFLSWHRAFLFFFEGVLKQAARDAGDTTAFELPYWDWYTQPVMPRSFTRATDPSGQPNPLWHRRARTDLSEDALDMSAFTYDRMLAGAGTPRARTFSYPFEQDPHGVIHGLIGGDMGFVPTSARDPVFWLHHANIDRLWTAWIKSGSRTVPTSDSEWAQKRWTFDTQGNWVQQAGLLLDSETSLNYRYDDESAPTGAAARVAAVASSAPRKVLEAPAVAMDLGRLRGAARQGPLTMSATRAPITLGNSAIAVDLHLATQNATQLHSLAAKQPTDLQSAFLVLEDVELGSAGGQGGFSFKIVASLPDAPGGERRAVIGNLNTFSLSLAEAQPSQRATPGKQTLKFPLPDVLEELQVKSPDALAKGLRITFVPAHSDEHEAEPELVKIGAVKIVGSGAPEPNK